MPSEFQFKEPPLALRIPVQRTPLALRIPKSHQFFGYFVELPIG